MRVAVVGVSAAAAACLAEEPLGDEGRGAARQGEESLDDQEHRAAQQGEESFDTEERGEEDPEARQRHIHLLHIM